MMKFFRKIRFNLIGSNRPTKYLKYALGEIILVMVGILLALQVNNWNIEKTDKKRELKYLTNIVLDGRKDILRLDYLIEFRKTRLLGDQKLIDEMNGLSLGSLDEPAFNVINSLMEDNFSPNNTTFLELSNSGNLNLLSNDTIKVLLLELEERYEINKLNVAHEIFDYREYISKPISKYVNIDQLFPVYAGHKTIEEQNISLNTFDDLFKSRDYKNGLFLMRVMASAYIVEYQDIKSKSEKIIELIELEKQ